MKKNQLATLWVIACCLLFSCHKPDFPGATKGCQLIRSEGHNLSYDSRYIYTFSYNNKRLMDTLKWGPGFLPEPPLVIDIQYNAQSQPVLMKSVLSTTKMIYQNGRIIRIDELGTDNLYHVRITFKYDIYGRVIESSSVTLGTTRYEYKDASRNFSRRIGVDANQPDGWGLMEEYKYDHKVNPRATWPNLALNPLSMEIYEDMPSSFEPITDNNCIYQASIGRVYGVPFTYQELFHSYEYDNVYPVIDHVRKVNHSTADPDRVTLSEIKYTYDCAPKGAHGF